jgi:hypothetical protein
LVRIVSDGKPVNASRREDIRLLNGRRAVFPDTRGRGACGATTDKRVLKIDGAFALMVLRFDTAYGCEG